MTKPKWLEMSEYTVLSASAVGTVAAVVSQQVIYAAVPLVLTLGLNVVSRQKLHQLNPLQNPIIATKSRQPVVTFHLKSTKNGSPSNVSNYDLRQSKFGGGFAARGSQIGGTLNDYSSNVEE